MQEDYKGPVEYSLEMAIEKIVRLLGADYGISKRAVAVLLLQDDEEIKALVREKEAEALSKIEDITEQVSSHYLHPLTYELALERQAQVRRIINKAVTVKQERVIFREKISRMTMNPITGLPIALFILYWGILNEKA